MLYSRMSAEQKKVLLDDAKNFPMKVEFLGKAGILTYEEVEFLRQQGVDFDVDQDQADEVLREAGVSSATPSTVEEAAGCLLAIVRLLHGPRR